MYYINILKEYLRLHAGQTFNFNFFKVLLIAIQSQLIDETFDADIY